LAVLWGRRWTVAGPPFPTFDVTGCSGEALDCSRTATANKETPAYEKGDKDMQYKTFHFNEAAKETYGDIEVRPFHKVSKEERVIFRSNVNKLLVRIGTAFLKKLNDLEFQQRCHSTYTGARFLNSLNGALSNKNRFWSNNFIVQELPTFLPEEFPPAEEVQPGGG
jgi:hypothetical protein